jgi:hypothetical protein
MLIHLDEGIKGRPPEYVRPEQFIDFEYVFLTISERRTRSRARGITLFDNFPRNGVEAGAPPFDDDHIERSVDDSFIQFYRLLPSGDSCQRSGWRLCLRHQAR